MNRYNTHKTSVNQLLRKRREGSTPSLTAKFLNKNSELRVAVFLLGTIWDPNADFNIVV